MWSYYVDCDFGLCAFVNLWHPGWVIIVAGAVVCGIASLIVNTVCDLKNINKKENHNKQD